MPSLDHYFLNDYFSNRSATSLSFSKSVLQWDINRKSGMISRLSWSSMSLISISNIFSSSSLETIPFGYCLEKISNLSSRLLKISSLDAFSNTLRCAAVIVIVFIDYFFVFYRTRELNFVYYVNTYLCMKV